MQIFSSEDKNLQENKTDFTVTIFGAADIFDLSPYERELLLKGLLQRITELARGGER